MTNGNQAVEQEHVRAGAASPFPVSDLVSAADNLPLRQSMEIQGDILATFNKDHRSFLLLQFPNGDQGRGWLTEFSGAIIAKLQAGNQVTVVGGPQAPDNHTWWNVRMQDGHTGWSAANFLRAA